MKNKQKPTFFQNPTEIRIASRPSSRPMSTLTSQRPLSAPRSRPMTANSQTSHKTCSTHALLQINKDFDDDSKSVRSNMSRNSKNSIKSNTSKDSQMRKSIERSKSQIDKFKNQLDPNESKYYIDNYKKSKSQLKEEQLKMLDNLKIQKGNYSLHGKYDLDQEQERVPRVEFVEDDEIDEVKSIQLDQNVDQDGKEVDLEQNNQNAQEFDNENENKINEKTQSYSLINNNSQIGNNKSSFIKNKDNEVLNVENEKLNKNLQNYKPQDTNRSMNQETDNNSIQSNQRARGFNSHQGLKSINNLNQTGKQSIKPTKNSDQEKSQMIKNLEKKLFGKVQSVLPTSSKILVKNYPNYQQDWVKYGDHY